MKVRVVLWAVILMGFAGTARAETFQKTILALGDSITAGAPAFRSPAEAPPEGRGNPESQYAYWIQKKYPAWMIVNRGISRQTTTDVLARLDRELNQTQPQIVILMVGVNDIFRDTPQETVLANLQAIYEKIQTQGIPLMVLTVLPYRGLTPQKVERLNLLNRWIHSYAMQHQLGFCDTFRVMRSESNPLSLSTTRDGLHPDPQGYRVMGEAIAAALAEWAPFKKFAEL